MPSQYVKGLDELLDNLKDLPEKFHNNVFRAAVRGGASEYVKESRKNLGSGYDTLKRSLKVKSERGGRGWIRLKVHPERGRGAKYDGWYAHIVEFGSYKHPSGWDITPWKSKSGSGKKALSLGANTVFSKVHHPGIRPTRFMTRALSAERRMIDGMLKAGRKNFDKQIKKNWLKYGRA